MKQRTSPRTVAELAVASPLEPMEALAVKEIPTGPGWQYEPKWDGFRCVAFRAGSEVVLQSKAGKRLDRYFPELVDTLVALPTRRFVVDGEIVIPMDGGLSFDALLQRIHPAPSRVARLARETPCRLMLFDLLLDARGRSRLAVPLAARRPELEAFWEKAGSRVAGVALSPATRDLAIVRRWFERGGRSLDGVVAKLLDAPYTPGERGAMRKVKHERTADCVVGGFRWASGGEEAGERHIGSLLLGLYDAEGKLDHVGFTASFARDQREAITRRVAALRGGRGFTGNAPGGPSRWSTERSADWEPVKPELVVEVAFDHTSGGRFRHGTRLVRFRPDKSPEQCTREQLESVAADAALFTVDANEEP